MVCSVSACASLMITYLKSDEDMSIDFVLNKQLGKVFHVDRLQVLFNNLLLSPICNSVSWIQVLSFVHSRSHEAMKIDQKFK